jgi:hypothetical protein
MTSAPFTSHDEADYNRFTHYPTTAAEMNAGFQEASGAIREQTAATLARWGIPELPADVQEALDQLDAARIHQTRETIRARNVAPPWSVVGRSNYRGNPDRAHKIIEKAGEVNEKAKKRLEKVLRRYNPNRPISSDDEDAIERLQDKIEDAQESQELMKAANKIIRKKVPDIEKMSSLAELGISGAKAAELLKPDFCGRIGFPDYALQNNLANIKRMEARVEGLQRRKNDKPADDIQFDGGWIEDNQEDNRVQIFFRGKPDEAVRNRLKSRGFRWAPSVGAWQRMRSGTHVLKIAREIVSTD